MSALKEKLTTLVEPLLDSLGLKLWGLEFLPAGRSILRIYIEKADGADAAQNVEPYVVGIAECTEAARLIGLTLDVEDPISGAYLLEVSTPGLERIFFKPEQLAGRAGEVVEIQLSAPKESHPGRKKFIGRLGSRSLGDPGSATGGLFSLTPLDPASFQPESGPVLDFAWSDLKKAKLVYMEPEKPGAPQKGQGGRNGPAKGPAAPKKKSADHKKTAPQD